MNVVLSTTQAAVLRSVFGRVAPYQALSLLQALLTGSNGPFSPREISSARLRVSRAGYAPDSLVAVLGLRRSDLTG